MFEWTYEERVPTTATPARIWERWSNPQSWPEWDHEVEWARLEGPFVRGARGMMKPRGGPSLPFTLTRVEPDRAFSDRSVLPLAHVDFIHCLEGGAIVHRVEIRGFLTPLFRVVIGRPVARGLREAMTRLARLAESA